MNFTSEQLAAFYSTCRPTPFTVAHQMGSSIGDEESWIPANITTLLASLVFPDMPEGSVPTMQHPKTMAQLFEAYIAGLRGAPLPGHLPQRPASQMVA